MLKNTELVILSRRHAETGQTLKVKIWDWSDRKKNVSRKQEIISVCQKKLKTAGK